MGTSLTVDSLLPFHSAQQSRQIIPPALAGGGNLERPFWATSGTGHPEHSGEPPDDIPLRCHTIHAISAGQVRALEPEQLSAQSGDDNEANRTRPISGRRRQRATPTLNAGTDVGFHRSSLAVQIAGLTARCRRAGAEHLAGILRARRANGGETFRHCSQNQHFAEASGPSSTPQAVGAPTSPPARDLVAA